MTHYLLSSSIIPAFMAFPKFLLERTSLNETAKIVYMILLDRAKCSQLNCKWADNKGRVFIYYPIEDIASVIHKSESSVKSALAALEKNNLIFREHRGIGKSNRIYVKLPALEERKLSSTSSENYPCGRQKTDRDEDGKLSGSKIKDSKTNGVKRKSKVYGAYRNVLLSDGDIKALQQDVPQYQDYIERLSNYMQSTGKRYADHAATIRSWYLQDNPTPPARNYECEENESL